MDRDVLITIPQLQKTTQKGKYNTSDGIWVESLVTAHLARGAETPCWLQHNQKNPLSSTTEATYGL